MYVFIAFDNNDLYNAWPVSSQFIIFTNPSYQFALGIRLEMNNNRNNFSIKQKVTILVAMLVELVTPSVKPFERLPFVSKTRGNVFQRFLGKLTADEHKDYIDSANKIRLSDDWCKRI